MNGLDSSIFLNPGAEFRPAPLWVWNDEMTTAEIRKQLQELKLNGFGGAFVHPRPGLITEYLSDEWFARWSDALTAAAELDLKLYIYDENSYPSGFAGGHVSSQLPDCFANSVNVRRLDATTPVNLNGPLIKAYVYEASEEESGKDKIVLISELTHLPTAAWSEHGSRFLVFELGTPELTPWLAGFAYADLLRPEVTQLFLQTTHEQYRSRFGEHFGSRIPAIFTDEPEISPGSVFREEGGALPFSYWFASRFEDRNGYDLKDHLPALFLKVEGTLATVDAEKVRFDYYSTVHELWVNNSIRPISEWCSRNGIAYTGHYMEHHWPYPWSMVSPSIMSFYEYMHWPAIDMLMCYLLLEDGSDPHLMVTIREAQSAANQFNRPRVLCETYGAGGWDSNFEDYKRIGDWLFVHGVNFMNQHLTYSTIVGARKRDHPQSFDWRQPWWSEYGSVNDYFARLSYVLSQGETHNRVLVLNPTTSFYLNLPDSVHPSLAPTHSPELKEDLELFQQLCDHQWDFDFGDEYIMERHGRVDGNQLRVGERNYDVIIVPRTVKQLKTSSVKLIEDFTAADGRVIYTGGKIDWIDGRVTEKVEHLAKLRRADWIYADGPTEVDRRLRELLSPRVEWDCGDGICPRGLASLRREIDDTTTAYFIVNSGLQPVSANLRIEGRHADVYDPWTGLAESAAYRYEAETGKLLLPVSIPNSGSLLLIVSELEQQSETLQRNQDTLGALVQTSEVHSLKDWNPKWTIQAEMDNTLIIDYCDLTVGSKTYGGINTAYASQLVFERHGFRNNPWERAVQFKRRLLDRNDSFDTNSGFNVRYHFYIRAGEVPSSIRLLIERADLYRIEVNGTIGTTTNERSWLDHHIGEVDISGMVIEGENTVLLTAQPFSLYHEIETIFVQGDFGVYPEDERWVVGKPTDLSWGAWGPQGFPFYGGAVQYTQFVDVDESLNKMIIRVNNWNATVISIAINDVAVGMLGIGAGDELDVTRFTKPGSNEISLRVSGSLKNMLGPHHEPDHPRKRAWPVHWKNAPKFGPPHTSGYDLIDYGIMDPIEIIVSKKG